MRGICDGVEHYLWSSDSRPAYRGICALRSSKPIPWCTAVRLTNATRVMDEHIQRLHDDQKSVHLSAPISIGVSV